MEKPLLLVSLFFDHLLYLLISLLYNHAQARTYNICTCVYILSVWSCAKHGLLLTFLEHSIWVMNSLYSHCRLQEGSSCCVCHILRSTTRLASPLHDCLQTNNKKMHFTTHISLPSISSSSFYLLLFMSLVILTYLDWNLVLLVLGDQWFAWSNRTKSACSRRCTGFCSYYKSDSLSHMFLYLVIMCFKLLVSF